ncbi:chemotaxis protein CheW [Megalodesulfovibrio paquesii]
MLYDTQNSQQAEVPAPSHPVRQQADLKVERTLGDALLIVLQDLLSNHQQLRMAGDSGEGLARPLDEQDALLERLKDIAVGVRAANFTKLFRQMKALAMDMARRCDKELDLRLDGAELSVDIAILEALEDPLAHLVRNAVEHGLESPDDRRAKGKPPRGRLELRAYCRNGAVRVDVLDDGRGPGAGLSQGAPTGRQSAPGFSGLARIEQAMAALHGSFSLHPAPGGGTVATCNIPLAFQFLDGVVFQAGEHQIVIPLEAVAAIQPLRGTELSVLQQHEVLVYDSRTILYLDLARVLGGRNEAGEPLQKVILTASSGERFALGVDAVRGRYRGAVSPLAPCCNWGSSLGGCVLLSGGGIGFVLDVDALAAESVEPSFP